MYACLLSVAAHIYRLKNEDIAKNASATMNRTKEIYERSLKVKELDPLRVESLARKYQRMELAAKALTDAREKKWREKRRECARHFGRVEEVRRRTREREREKAERVVAKLVEKEMNATKSKVSMFREVSKRKACNYNKLKEARQLVALMRLEDAADRERLKKKHEEDLMKTREIKEYREYVKSIRAETALRFKYVKNNKDYTNPYLAAEIRASQIAIEEENKKKSSIQNIANKTSCTLYYYCIVW